MWKKYSKLNSLSVQGAQIVSDMLRHSPPEVFDELISRGSVGLFTWTDKTTIFPEYEHLRDTPECAGFIFVNLSYSPSTI